MKKNFIKLKNNFKFYLFNYKKKYLIFILSNNFFILKKIVKNKFKLILYFNYLFFLSSKKLAIKSIYSYFISLFFSINLLYKRTLEAIGRGLRFIFKKKKKTILI